MATCKLAWMVPAEMDMLNQRTPAIQAGYHGVNGSVMDPQEVVVALAGGCHMLFAQTRNRGERFGE